MTLICDPALRLRLIAAAQEAVAPDIVIRGGRVWNAFTGEVTAADVVICGDRIAKVGEWRGPCGEATQVIDATDRVLVPGYIEPHTHPWPFANPLSLAEAAVSRGTTCLVYDQLMMYLAMGETSLARVTRTLSAAALPHVYWLARIASQSRFADEARLFAPDVIRRQLGAAEYLGTAEMTRWSDLLDPERALPLLAVIEDARRLGKINDGHMAGASPRRLAALATTGIRSCHEAINAEEALGRLRQGLWVLLRNSSLREDLAALLPCLDATAFHDRLAFTTDGASEPHLADHGFIDHLVAIALDAGVAANVAYRMATLNPANFLGLGDDLGAVAPGRVADVNLLSDLDRPKPLAVVCRGRLVARDGSLTVAEPSATFRWAEAYAGSRPEIPDWGADMFLLPATAANPFPAGRLESAAITRETPERLEAKGGGLWPTSPEALVLAATDRGGHWITRGVVLDMASDLEALATTYTTSAGVLLLGRSPEAMAEALARLKRLGGGTVLRSAGREWCEFGFPMAGIHATGSFAAGADAARAFASSLRASGYRHADPKYTLLFLTCDMLPEVRATEAGWVRIKTMEVLHPAETPGGDRKTDRG
ncbi:MAG: adenine deaminase [Rhodospirillales bacterium]|nr:adenine deaminase [Rhodospirillales bacterium]